MKYLHSKFIDVVLGGVLLTALPQLASATDNWMGFIPPSPTVSNAQSTYQNGDSHKTTWRSGANFKTHSDFNYNVSSSSIVNAKEYALTQPQRKSVNPWHVDRSWSAKKQYKFGPAIRPWGSVPEQFQKRSSASPVYPQNRMQRNFMPPPPPPYQPNWNNNVLNHSGSLLPVGAYSAFIPGVAYMNNQNLFTPPYGFSRAYLWR